MADDKKKSESFESAEYLVESLLDVTAAQHIDKNTFKKISNDYRNLYSVSFYDSKNSYSKANPIKTVLVKRNSDVKANDVPRDFDVPDYAYQKDRYAGLCGWTPSDRSESYAAQPDVLKNITSNLHLLPVFQHFEYKQLISTLEKDYKNNTTSYKVNDAIPIPLSDGYTYTGRIVAVNADELSDGSGNAKYTIIFDETLYYIDERWTRLQSTTSTVQEYPKSDLKKFVDMTIMPMLPADLQDAIKPVKKTYTYFDTAGNKHNDGESVEKVWVPSYRELFGGTDYETSGPIYSEVFKDAKSRLKRSIDNNFSDYWLRSIYAANDILYVDRYIVENNNAIGHAGYSDVHHICIGFCL